MKQTLKKRLAEFCDRSESLDRYLSKKLSDDHNVDKLFDLGCLDPDEPVHQRLVFFTLADLMFPPKQKRKKGASKWTESKLRKLLDDFANIEKERPTFSVKRLTELLVKRGLYSDTPESLRRALGRAARIYKGEYGPGPSRVRASLTPSIPTRLRRALIKILSESR